MQSVSRLVVRRFAGVILMGGLAGCGSTVDRDLPEPSQGEPSLVLSAVDRDARVKPIATFEARVVVLGEKRYGNDNPSDPLAGLAPVDLAVGWGVMGQEKIRDEVSISQGRRRYRWHAWAKDLPMETIDKVGVSSANWHIIPSGPSTRKKLMAIDEGDEVHLKGWLVEAVSQNGQVSRSSLSRTDAGDGACEIIWVTDISVK